MKKTTVFSLMVALLAMLLLVPSCAKEEKGDMSLSEVQEKGEFILGLDDSFPPMGFRDEKGDVVGFDIDVAKEVCKHLGVELKIQVIDWSAKEQEIATGNIDCIWNGFTKTAEREKVLSFSHPYCRNAQVVVVRGDSGINTLSDLKGAKVGLQSGSSAEAAVDETPGLKESLDEIVPFKENLTALMDLEAKGVDAVVLDLLVANDAIRRSGKDFRILDETLTEEEYAIGFRKGDLALVKAVDDALLEMAKDGSLAEIAVKWFGADITVVGK